MSKRNATDSTKKSPSYNSSEGDLYSEGSSIQEPATKRSHLEIVAKTEAEEVMLDVKREPCDLVKNGNASSSMDTLQINRGSEEDEEDVEFVDEYYEEESDTDGERTEVPPMDVEFERRCTQLELSAEIMAGAWAVYNRARERIILEGNQNSWQLAALYYYFLSKYVKGRKCIDGLQVLPAAVNDMLSVFGVSAIEFFDKVLRFLGSIPSNSIRKYMEYVQILQENLAVTTVIFKKFVKIYRMMFKFVSSKQTNPKPIPTTLDIFSVIWTMFLVIKRSLATEDLSSCFHLIISIFDTVYTDMCNRDEKMDAHFNPEFVEFLLETDMTIIRALCNKFDGVVLDARHFLDHVFFKLLKTDLPEDLSIRDNCATVLEHLNNVYTKWILVRGQVDERIFIPTEEELQYVFDENFDGDKMAEILQKSADSMMFSEADLLAKLSNQDCLDKVTLADSKEGNSVIGSKDAHRVSFVSTAEMNEAGEKESLDLKMRLKTIIGNWKLETSKLKKYFDKMTDNPTATILLKRDIMCDKLTNRINEEMSDNETFDLVFVSESEENKQLLEKLFLIFLEKIVVCEIEKKCREEDLLNVIRKDEFLDSVFCFSAELVLFSCRSERAFPWSAQLCDIHPFSFHKIIDLIINHEKMLNRAMVQHFNAIEERIIEELAWTKDSPIWHMMLKYPLESFSEFGEHWFDKGHSPLKFANNKLTDDLGRPVLPSSGHSRTIRMFLKRTYFTSAIRLHDLCDRIGLSQRATSQVWSIFDYVLRSETAQLMDKHLDQILLCCVYVAVKINRIGTTFMEIMAHYKRQPQANKNTYRQVIINAGYLNEETADVAQEHEDIESKLNGYQEETVTVDIIKYYNLVFRDRVKGIVHDLETASDEDLKAMPVPTSYGLTPMKIHLTRNVAIQSLPKTAHRTTQQEIVIANILKSGLHYDVTQSPRKELQMINSRLAARN